jgi:phage/plasmid-like protein (TIGR03299 family)
LHALGPDGVSRPVPRKHLISRSDTQAPLAVVGDRYTVIPHRRLVDLARAIIRDSGGALRAVNAGHLGGGVRPYVQLACDQSSPVGEVRRNLSLFADHGGTLCATVGFSATMIVCRNTYSHALGQAVSGLKIRHTASAEDMLTQIEEIASLASQHADAWDNAALRMLGTRFGDSDMHALASKLIPGESTRATNSRAELMAAWQSSPGARPGTAWGAAQAVTYHTSHTLGSAEARAESAIFGTGTAIDFQQSAFAVLDADESTMRAQLARVQLFRLA